MQFCILKKVYYMPVIVLSILLTLVYYPCYSDWHVNSCITKVEIKVQESLMKSL